MKFLGLFRTESIGAIKRFPIVLLVLLLCLIAFLAALPKDLFESRGVPQVSVAIVYDGSDNVSSMVTAMVSALGPIKDFYSVDRERALELLAGGDVDIIVQFPSDMIDVLVDGKTSVIHVQSNNAIIAGIAYGVTAQAVNTINSIQNKALEYRYTVSPLYDDLSEFSEQERIFDMKLMGLALARTDAVYIQKNVSVYQLQMISIMLFLLISIISIMLALTASKQFASGTFRRLLFHGVPLWQMYVIKFILTFLMTLLFSVVFFYIFAQTGIDVSAGGWIVSSLLLCIFIYPICMIFSAIGGKESTSSIRTLLGSVAVLLFLLFIGGGFYPVYMMDASIRLFNPAWATHLLAEWILGGTVALVSIIPCLIPAVICAAITIKRWNGAHQ